MKRNETRLCASGRVQWQRFEISEGISDEWNGINIRAELADSQLLANQDFRIGEPPQIE